MRHFADAFTLVSNSRWTPAYDDLHLLFDRVRARRPRNILEIGTNEGGSTLVMHYAWPDAHIISVDVSDTCPSNPELPIGHLVRTHAPEAKVTFVKQYMGKVVLGLFQVIFIDGNHVHPFPTLDLLYALPFADTNFELAMHDVGLSKLFPERVGEKGADSLWSAIAPFAINPQLVGLTGCATLVNEHFYYFASKILTQSTLWDSQEKSQ